MNLLSLPGLSLGLAGYLAAGFVAGLVYFRSLWWNAQLFAAGRGVATIIALVLGRFALLGGVLFLTSRAGALPLLLTALGVLIARAVVVRAVREATP